MFFDIAQIPLMIEDLYDRQVTVWLCMIAFLCAVFQGGMTVVFGATLGAIVTYPFVRKDYLGFIDGVFLGVYAGLLQDLNKISVFFIVTGCLGILWHYIKCAPAPLIFLMGLSYFVTCQ